MKTGLYLTLLGMLVLSSSVVRAQTIWNDGAGDADWFNSANWSSGVPTTTTNVQIGTMVGGDTIVGIAGNNVTVASFTFNNTLPNGVQVLAGSAEQLTVNGGITNNSSFQNGFGLTVNAGANATYAGGTAGLVFNFLSVGTKTIGTSGSILTNGTIVFNINSLSTYGSIGSINATGATINIGGTYTGHAGDTFDLTTGTFSGATLGVLPTLGAGLVWDTSSFISNGTLTVNAVPEPSAYALLGFGVLALLFLQARTRRNA